MYYIHIEIVKFRTQLFHRGKAAPLTIPKQQDINSVHVADITEPESMTGSGRA